MRDDDPPGDRETEKIVRGSVESRINRESLMP
jgi:hypothetical protein